MGKLDFIIQKRERERERERERDIFWKTTFNRRVDFLHYLICWILSDIQPPQPFFKCQGKIGPKTNLWLITHKNCIRHPTTLTNIFSGRQPSTRGWTFLHYLICWF